MGKPVKNATGGWKVQVQVKGVRTAKTFATKAEAEYWAARQKMTVTPAAVSNITFYDLCVEWHNRYADNRKYPVRERQRIEWHKDDALFKTKLKNLSGKAVADWRDRQTVSPSSVNRDWNLFSAICTVAIKEMDMLTHNPFAMARRPIDPPARKRVASDTELAEIKKYCNPHVWNVVVFATETGMRLSEIAGLQWDDVSGRTATLKKTKNGDRREVPLSSKALAAMGEPALGSVFGLTGPQIYHHWKLAVTAARIQDLTFHDLRAYACVKLSKVLDALQLAKVMGWRNVSQALTYYRMSAGDMAAQIDAAS